MKAVCEALGVARSNVVRLRSKPAEQADRRRLAKDPKADAVVLEEIRRAIDAQPSYGYPESLGADTKRSIEGPSSPGEPQAYPPTDEREPAFAGPAHPAPQRHPGS